MVRKIGFIGLGSIGKPIAMNIAKAGFDLMVYDLRAKPLQELAALGASIAASAQEVGAHAEIVCVQVVDDAQVETVMLGEKGVLSEAKAGAVVAIQSTIHPRTMKKITEVAAERQVGLVDAQVSGGERGAYMQGLTFMVGGEKEDVEKCRPVFAASGKSVFHMGPLGTGAVTKLAHQIIVIGTMMSVAEGMLFAEKTGVNPEAFAEVVHASSARSHIADSWLNRFRVVPRNIVDIFYKSVIPAMELAHELDIPLPMTAVAQQLMHSRMPGARQPSNTTE
jgi:3-hydroxyisobutyrate dehydrogenase-like beta-hydroxyacid dehydrogenase